MNRTYWIISLLICGWFTIAAFDQWKTPTMKSSSSSSRRGGYYGGGGWFGGK